jgi:hypothetical protein
MIGRPCKPDSDLKGLWRTLLGTPFPACGIAEGDESSGDHPAAANSADRSVKRDATATRSGNV